MVVWTRGDVVNFIKQDLLLDQLDLKGTGLTLVDIKDETPLAEGGLAIDSVDMLDLLVGVEREYALHLPDLTSAFVQQTCHTVDSLASFVHAQISHRRDVQVA